MSYELPFQRRVERQARPRAVFGKMNPGHGLGSTSGISEIPPIKNIISSKKTGLKKLAKGGICYMAGGGDYDELEGMNDAASGSGDMFSRLPDLSADQSLDPMGGQPNPFATEKPEEPTGFGGWLQNKHGGITGSNWLQAATQLFTGILGGIAAKRNNSKDAGPNTGTSFAPMGALGGYARGGIVEPLDGPRRMSDGGIMQLLTGSALQPAMSPAVTMMDMIKDPEEFFGMNGTGPNAAMGRLLHKGPKTAGQASEAPGMAEGGEAPTMQPGAPQPQEQGPGGDPQDQMIVANAIKAILGQSQDPQGAIQAFVQRFGQEALQSLVQKVQESAQQGSGGGQQMAPQQGQMAGGGILSGGGSGMSDDIPANGGSLRVSNGEYIVPADAVSQLGDGSTDAGARRLDQGIAALRKQKYGHTNQPKKLKPNANPILSGK